MPRDYEPKDVKLGLRCVAPIKRNGKRAYEEVEVVWVSKDGFVVEALARPSKKGNPVRQSFSSGDLRKPGTKTPSIGYVVL